MRWYLSWVLKDKDLSAVDLLEEVQLLQRNSGRRRHGCLEKQLVLPVWLKCRAKRGEVDGVSREVLEKEAGVAAPSQREKIFVCLAMEFRLGL